MTRLVQVLGRHLLPQLENGDRAHGHSPASQRKGGVPESPALVRAHRDEFLVSLLSGEIVVCVRAGGGKLWVMAWCKSTLCRRQQTQNQDRTVKVLPWMLLHNKSTILFPH